MITCKDRMYTIGTTVCIDGDAVEHQEIVIMRDHPVHVYSARATADKFGNGKTMAQCMGATGFELRDMCTVRRRSRLAD